jgi:hypothetical protein
LYVSAIEKENKFLREEIEKCKYSKSKDDYSKFISGLVSIKKSDKFQDSKISSSPLPVETIKVT